MNRSMLTVKQLSKLAGVTPRTLHHYDQIGLLKPSRVGDNGYRYYGEESLLRLQQILFYRELGIPLEDIKKIMGEKSLFEGFSEEEQEKYAAEAEELYGAESVQESNRKWKAYPAAKKAAIMAEGKAVYMDMIAAMPKGAASKEAQEIVERWRRHLEYFWTPNLDQLLALANGYSDDPSFKANFDKMHHRLAEFMGEAVTIYVAHQKK